MSAIIGRLSFDRAEILARTVLDQMLDASATGTLETRSVFAVPGIALGWCGPARPDGTSAIGTSDRHHIRAVADSRLTNAGELRAELEREGHRFHARTDEELIAHAYDRWGTGGFERLRGPFACAVWDDTTRRLVLARDHIGIRPLYFALLQGHGVVFASEIRALLQDPGVPRDWCPNGIDAYLALGYIPAPLTAYRRVSKLEPAQFLVVDGRRLHVEQFWDLPVPSSTNAPRDLASALTGALKSAARRDLKDQKHAGLLYSGGIASCALLSAAPAGTGVPITVDVDVDASELTRSDAAAAHLGRVRELETIAQPTSSLIEELSAIGGEPIGDPSAVTQLAICKAAARHGGIALSAHGAAVLWAPNARRLALLDRFTRPRGLRTSKLAYRLWDDEHRRSIYTRGFAWEVREANPFVRHLERYASRPTNDPVDRAMYVDARTFLPDNTLVVAARAAAAAGISLRYPFLDRQMVELSTVTPASLKLHGRIDMWALRRLLMPQLPPRLLPPALRQPPRHPWLPGALTMLVPKMLFGPRFDGRGIVSRPALRQLWNEHLTSRADHSRRLWALLMLEFWFREFIDGDAAAEPLEYAVLVKAA
ncbi:MAG TPA: asparagine synthase-related protein [Vicinamibacterales bacterium]|nr:asparagine synthase-related protein [Vicinamibacterales bacterium]